MSLSSLEAPTPQRRMIRPLGTKSQFDPLCQDLQDSSIEPRWWNVEKKVSFKRNKLSLLREVELKGCLKGGCRKLTKK